jgi:hypothetical protein
MLILVVAAAVLAQFVPGSFTPSAEHRTAGFHLVPLGPALAKQDFDAYMSSIEHLQRTFTFNTKWPHAGLTMADAVKDVEGEQERFQSRKSFTYAVLTPDRTRELGCVYISPSRKQGFEAVVRIWVTKAEFDRGFEKTLIPEVKSWLAARWPFEKVAWPGREIPREDFAKLPDKP